MIAIDSSSLIAFLQGDAGKDVELVDFAFAEKQAALPPVVLTEILCDTSLDRKVLRLIEEIPTLEIGPGYWVRAAQTRAVVLTKGRKAGLADTLICQSCIDHKVPLITRDKDFLRFEKYVGLRLLN